MKKIFVVSSINMDLTINAPAMPKEGETVEAIVGIVESSSWSFPVVLNRVDR